VGHSRPVTGLLYLYLYLYLFRVSLKYAGRLCDYVYHNKIYVEGRTLKKLSLLMYVRRNKKRRKFSKASTYSSL
jgi:hypothetical protein